VREGRTALMLLSVFLLLSFCAAASAGVDWGYGWPNSPTVPPNPTPTPTATPNPTDTPTATPEPTEQVTPTPQPTPQIEPIQTVNPTTNPQPTPNKIPELTLIFVLLGLIAVSLIVVVVYRRKTK
jgi:outer membrane biosynthesis protein TonB